MVHFVVRAVTFSQIVGSVDTVNIFCDPRVISVASTTFQSPHTLHRHGAGCRRARLDRVGGAVECRHEISQTPNRVVGGVECGGGVALRVVGAELVLERQLT